MPHLPAGVTLDPSGLAEVEAVGRRLLRRFVQRALPRSTRPVTATVRGAGPVDPAPTRPPARRGQRGPVTGRHRHPGRRPRLPRPGDSRAGQAPAPGRLPRGGLLRLAGLGRRPGLGGPDRRLQGWSWPSTPSSISLLFGVSALFHRHTWGPVGRRRMRRADHSTIFIAIAGSYTAVAGIALTGWARTAVLCIVWGGAVVGIVLRQVWLDAPKWVIALPYVVVGWAAVVVLPQLYRALGGVGFTLLLAGGLAYSAGAVVYAVEAARTRCPGVFGYHEVFHACTIVGARRCTSWSSPGSSSPGRLTARLPRPPRCRPGSTLRIDGPRTARPGRRIGLGAGTRAAQPAIWRSM